MTNVGHRSTNDQVNSAFRLPTTDITRVVLQGQVCGRFSFRGRSAVAEDAWWDGEPY